MSLSSRPAITMRATVSGRLRGAVEDPDIHANPGLTACRPECVAPPPDLASASRTAPSAGSTSQRERRWLRGATAGSSRATSSRSHGAALNIPPARTNVNSSSVKSSWGHRRTRLPRQVPGLPRARIAAAAASPSSRACWTSVASAAMHGGLEILAVDGVKQFLRTIDAEMRQQAAASDSSAPRGRRPRARSRASPDGPSSNRCPRRRARSPSRRPVRRSRGDRSRKQSNRCRRR